MQRILIFEGSDMTGKTNIAKALSEKLDIKVFKSTRERNRWWDPQVDFMYGVENIVQFLEQIGPSVIFDRFHASHAVYSSVFKRHVSESLNKEIDKRLGELGATIIFCFKSEEKYSRDEGDIIPTEKYNELNEEFWDFLDNTRCNVIALNTDDEDLDSQVQTILDSLELQGGLKND